MTGRSTNGRLQDLRVEGDRPEMVLPQRPRRKPAPSQRTKRLAIVGSLLATGLLISACGSEPGSGSAATVGSSQLSGSPTGSASPSGADPDASGGAAGEAPTPKVPNAIELRTATAVDGDTIKVDGRSVRIIGIDTPERGECGYSEASALTASLISGGVVLVESDTTVEEDVYGRQLRFVTTADGRDVGTELLRAGLANARYDSRDGYDAHKYESLYHGISEDTAHVCPRLDRDGGSSMGSNRAASSTRTQGSVDIGAGVTAGAGCDPDYGGVCVPVSSVDLDCADISGPVKVFGRDVHGFDRDGDGIGCDG